MLHSINRNKFRFTKWYCINPSPIQEPYSFSSITTKTHNPESSTLSLIQFFKKHGFTHAQVSSVVEKDPRVLKMNLQTTLLPKIEFFHSLGLSSVETAKIITSSPHNMRRSLKETIIPSYELLQDLLSSNEDVLYLIKRYPAILRTDWQKVVCVNVEKLKKSGPPKDKILRLFKQQPDMFLVRPDKFSALVEKIEKMGFNPSTSIFLRAIFVLNKAGTQWSRKVEAYKKWGFSENQVLAAFRRSPWFMATSVDKIERMLEYFTTDMGFDPLFLMNTPQIMALSLERTIVPRCTIYRVLTSKGLIRKNTSLSSYLKQSKKSFLEKFVLPFIEESPEISEVYLEKLRFPNKSKDG